MSDKNLIIDRLLYNQHITPEEAEVLRASETAVLQWDRHVTTTGNSSDIKLFPYEGSPADPYIMPYPEKTSSRGLTEYEFQKAWMDGCGCNPANGGNGICFCVIPGSGFTCSA